MPETTYCDPQPTPDVSLGYKLEAVIVCDGYADFLADTLPHNKFLFDKIVVVTSWEDHATRKLCEFHHVECIPTDALESRKGKFCKGAGINIGLEKLDRTAWVVHLDADIWLPPQTRVILSALELCKETLYGIDRFMVRNYEEWKKFLASPKLQHETEGWVHLEAFPIGTRVMAANSYIPIGFFQLWNPNGSKVHHYPEGHDTAAREDGKFAQNWKRSRRSLLSEIVGYHLESEPAVMGANWGGRKTKLFGPSK
jgi:hypothetical protein